MDTDRTEASPFHGVLAAVEEHRRWSLAEVADRVELDVPILERLFAAADRLHEDGYGERDVAYARRAGRLLDVYPLDTVLRALRVRMRALTSVVVNDLSAVRDEVVTPAHERGATMMEIADLLASTADSVLPIVTESLADDYRAILLRLLEADVVEQAARQGGREVELAVGFVDVVGFTALSAQVDPGGLDEVLGEFERMVVEAAGSQEGVLLPKFVGDAAMLVGEEVTTLAATLLDVVTDRRRLEDTPRHAGMAAGAVLVREGDYFGDTVNLAARLTDYARPWTMLAAENLRDRLDGFELSRLPPTRLHGIGTTRPWRVRPAGRD